MSYAVRLTLEAEDDLLRLYDFLLEQDPDTAERALTAIRKGLAVLADFPFTCRKAADANDPLLRELLISFGSNGYLALFQIDSAATVTVLALRHQREADYH